MNSSAIAASTNAQKVYATRPALLEPAPSATRAIPQASANTAGPIRLVPSARSEVRRQATSGPIPISSSSGRPSTRRKKSKYGGPTVIFSPRTSSDKSGKATPQSTVSVSATSSRLL